MATIVLDCSRCGSKDQTADLSSIFTVDGNRGQFINVAGFCRGCKKVLGISLVGNHRHTVQEVANYLGIKDDLTNICEIIEISPPCPTPNIPDYLPDNIERSFLEAERSRISGNILAAGMTYRRALEMATKDKARDLPARKILAQRIELLAKENRLTPALADWANHIKDLGNEAAHEEDEPTAADINALAALTRMTLIYLYEMPERVRRMREASQEQGAEA
ncbi:DUF4145 domain-containing protein [Gluconobacter oxydans]|uniref:DUF4145 domain-containing protein n=1 Tax=Gluconobacter oxydans TaxID=442 RepID=UPI0039E9F1FD